METFASSTKRKNGKGSIFEAFSIILIFKLCNLNVVHCNTNSIEAKLHQIHSVSTFFDDIRNQSLVELEIRTKASGIGNIGVTNQTGAASAVCLTEECLDSASSLLKSINFSVDPCTNFYEFACGRWILENPVPPSASRWNNLEIVKEKVKEVTRGILESPFDPMELESVNEAKEFYSMCINETQVENMGVGPLLEILEPYGGWPAITRNWDSNKFDVNMAVADGFRLFLQEVIVTIDLLKNVDNTKYLLHLNKPDEFFLPAAVLLNQTKYGSKINAYKTYFINMAKELAKTTGVSLTDKELLEQVEDVIRFETRLVSCNESEIETGKLDNSSRLDLKILVDHLFSTSGISVDLSEDIFSIDDPYISNLTIILDSTDARTVANYFAWRIITTFSGLTTNSLRHIELEFDKVNLGLVEDEPRNITCASLALGVYGMVITYKYVEETFDVHGNGNGTGKAKVTEMVSEIREAFMEGLNESSWMDDETKRSASKKMDAMKIFVAYPDWLFNQTKLNKRYEGLQVIPGESFRTVMGFLKWDANKTLNLLRTIPDVHINTWVYTPSSLSVFYRLSYNSLTLPARILQPPFYRKNGLESLNYGGIGTFIGHEITHAFDYSGSRFDFDGTKTSWWTLETLSGFRKRASCFSEQYNDLKTEVGLVDGKLTRNENVADNVGVRESFLAYRKWVQEYNGGREEPKLPGLEKYTSNQLFFLGYANSLCESVTQKSLLNTLLESTYSPARYRVQVPLQNFPEFAKQWNCPSGSPMNPPIDDQCFLL